MCAKHADFRTIMNVLTCLKSRTMNWEQNVRIDLQPIFEKQRKYMIDAITKLTDKVLKFSNKFEAKEK